MTHAELFATHRLPGGVPPSACPGELAEAARFPDVRLVRDRDDRPKLELNEVVVYDCPVCGYRLSVCESTVLNAYRPVPLWPREAVR